MNDYERVASVIRYLDAHHADQPDLDALAERAGLSRFHFHRLFSGWAGVTPKDFLQCLTVEHVKKLLHDGESVLDAALAGGLSGPGRLHDLCVSLEAASPGEIKSAGDGWTIDAGFASTPFGPCLVAQNIRGICHLSFVEPGDETEAWTSLGAEWSNAAVRRDDSVARSIVAQVFAPGNPSDSRVKLRAYVKGTAFQVRVWRSLLRVPAGHLTTYGRLAAALGQSSAARAVGTAIGQNPLAYLIPCHRVIRNTGISGGYRWGPIRKRAMLAWETGRSAGGTGALLGRTTPAVPTRAASRVSAPKSGSLVR